MPATLKQTATSNTPLAAAEFDSDAWRAERDARLREWIGDEEAVQCVLALFNVAEVLDDLVDGDPTDRREFMKAWRDTIFGLDRNRFWLAHRPIMSFLAETMTMQWETANELERAEAWKDRARAFFLRDSPTHLVGAVVGLLHGYERALAVSVEVYRFFPHEEPDDWEYRYERRR